MRGLAHAHAWAALWEACPKRPPLGFKHFFDACVEQGARSEAARYAHKLPAAEAVPLLLGIERVDEAREAARAVKEKQPELLRAVNAHVAGDRDGNA